MSVSALGILSAAGAGGAAAAGAYELISSTILGTAAASVDFTGLGTYSADYKHLQIRYTAKSTSGTVQTIKMRLNGITTGYAHHRLYGSGTSVASLANSGALEIQFPDGMSRSTTASAFSAGIYDILDVYSTSKNKTVKALYGNVDTNTQIYLTSGLLANTASITSISIYNDVTFAVGSRFSIYGIKG